MFDQNFLYKLVQARMPFGKYKGWHITNLPLHYLEWFNREGFPAGSLGQYISTMYEIKTNGLESLLDRVKREV
ncbi:MAG: DUF3820 family protein [Balneolales bacterium]